MTSPVCTVNGGSTAGGVSLTAGATLQTIALADTTGVSYWSLTCVGTDETTSAAAVNANLVVNNATKTATFTAPASGSCAIFQSIVGVVALTKDANGTVQPAFTTTFKCFAGPEVTAAGETTETDAAAGWNATVNPLLRGEAARSVKLWGAKGDGITDDTAAIQAALNANAGVRATYFPPATYKVASTITLPDNTHIIGIRGQSILNGTITPNADPSNAVLAIASGVASPGATTAHATVTVGGETLTVDGLVGSALVVGTWSGHYSTTPTYIRIADTVTGSGFRGGTYQVRSVSGGGPYTVTVDEPIFWSFGVNDAVTVLGRVPSDITVQGIKLTGTASRLFEGIGTQRCKLIECDFAPASGVADIVASWDTFGRDNEYVSCTVDGNGGSCTSGLALETQTRSRIRLSDVRRVTTTGVGGIVLFDCLQCDIIDCTVTDCYAGVAFTADGNVFGCTDCRLVRGHFDHNTTSGVAVVNGSTNTRFTDVCARYNASGAVVGDGSSAVSGTVISGKFDNSSTIGCTVASTALRTSFLNVDTSNSAVGFNAASPADVFINGHVHTGTTAAFPNGQVYIGSGTIVARNVKWAPTTVIDVCALTGGSVDVSGGSVTGGGGSNLFNLQSGSPTLRVSHLTLTVSGGGTGVVCASGKVLRGESVDTSGCAIEKSGAGSFNWGTFVSNGASAVTVGYVGAALTSRIVISLNTAGGTPSANYIASLTAGTGFTTKAAAGDTGTQNWWDANA